MALGHKHTLSAAAMGQGGEAGEVSRHLSASLVPLPTHLLAWGALPCTWHSCACPVPRPGGPLPRTWEYPPCGGPNEMCLGYSAQAASQGGPEML